jgi:hypothetical protein
MRVRKEGWRDGGMEDGGQREEKKQMKANGGRGAKGMKEMLGPTENPFLPTSPL